MMMTGRDDVWTWTSTDRNGFTRRCAGIISGYRVIKASFSGILLLLLLLLCGAVQGVLGLAPFLPFLHITLLPKVVMFQCALGGGLKHDNWARLAQVKPHSNPNLNPHPSPNSVWTDPN